MATNVLLFYFIRSSYSIATVLSVFLFGLGLGSFLIYRFSEKIKNPQKLFGFLQILIGLYAFFVFGSLLNIAPKIANHGIIYTSVLLLLIPTICLGAIFPLAGLIYKKEKKDIIGLIYFIDIIGAVAGSLAAGFLLIPNLGNINTIYIAVGLNLLSAIIILPKKLNIAAAAAIFGMIILTFIWPKYYQKTSPDTQFFAASAFGEVKVQENFLTIDGRVQCQFGVENYQGVKVISEEIKKLGENPKILNIGLGCGGTLAGLTEFSNKVDVVEINPVVVSATRKFSDILENPNVNLIVDDGLKYLEKTDKKYDAIVMIIDDPQVLASSDLYTSDAFKIYSQKLTENGFFTFAPIIQEVYCYDVFYYSLKDAFPYIYLDKKNPQQMFVASIQKKELAEYLPDHIRDINSVNKNTLQKCYRK